MVVVEPDAVATVLAGLQIPPATDPVVSILIPVSGVST